MAQTVWSQLMLVVSDVPASSTFYCELLGFDSGHGGDEYEQLTHDGEIIMQLHHDRPDDDHTALLSDDGARGNGVIAWFEVADFDAAVQRARALGARIEGEPQINPNAKQSELWLRDPDGYLVVIAGPSEYRPRS